jgi:hypothetical protein
LVHECTHEIQRATAPTEYAVALSLEAAFRAIPNQQLDDWFDLYIGQPFEQEARAAQAAAEVEELAGWAVSQSVFKRLLPNTEVWKRTDARIGGPGSASAKVNTWWAMWEALAWDTYR